MTGERKRHEENLAEWARRPPLAEDANPPVCAATLILVRDGAQGLETLMLRRNSKLAFVGGMWVFPGGRVDPADCAGLVVDDELGAARRAAVREAREEAGLEIHEDALVPFSHWTPPPITPKRFLTWFFITKATGAGVSIDRGEIHDHAWMRPADALARRDAHEIEIVPPTWITLHRLGGYPDAATAIEASRNAEPERFATRIVPIEGGAMALYGGDAAYECDDFDRPGPRHRLRMLPSGWCYERTG